MRIGGLGIWGLDSVRVYSVWNFCVVGGVEGDWGGGDWGYGRGFGEGKGKGKGKGKGRGGD